MSTPFPFTAVVGQDDLRLALLLNAVSPAVGGVLVRGEKGTAKSTVVRALAAQLPPVEVVTGCRFSCDPAAPDPGCPDGPHAPGAFESRQARMVELPVGASEDRLVGALDIERALAEVYAVWGGYAYGRGLDGRAARGDMETAFKRIAVAAKNVDTREHDSDDYFQYHGGMVATVRALTGRSPAAYVGDSAVPDAVRTRTLAEETKRVFRARVVNPRWIAAMQRHGYKGAFELAATVDYLFGYDATAGVVDDWMYTTLAREYVFDETNRAFMERSNPWALRGITERLLEAADRGMWAKPDDAVLERLRATYLELEGDLEGAG